eukprot:gb/GFBE01030756.1/.p1 GENE.gb/GFBE01030756.1/~~gb/GFBE01030756.1/.p1  ORF type:complete len:115 (+),score=25.60 gb/GFBE01030756.1/:1-345(+)
MPPLTGPRVPPRGSRELRPRGETHQPQKISQAQKQVDEVQALEKQAGDLVRRNDLRGALQMYEECKAEIEDTLDGLPKDDVSYPTLLERKKSVESKIIKCKEFLPFEYFLKAPN